ncbi:MAG: glycosyltransferase [Arcanobacterium sp.]|nr:glycosyltransferase [Arcanobacterium sp.]
MRIALISDCFAPRLGGIESQVQDLALQLQKAGHEVIVVTATPDQKFAGRKAEFISGIKVLRLAIPLPGSLPVNPFAGPALLQVMRNADIVHIHTGVISPFAQHAALLAAKHRIPSTITWHCMLNHMHWGFRIFRVMQWVARRGVAMNTVSELMARQIQSVLGDSGEVSVLYNGIDLAPWREVAALRRKLKNELTENEFVAPIRIVASRRLAPRKRNIELIKIAVEAQKLAGVPVELTIYGEGPERQKLVGLCKKLAVDWVKLPGRATRKELAEAYKNADIYFSTALMESFGIATLEARAAGVPIVAPANTGVDDFVQHHRHGLLGKNDRELAQFLAQLITDSQLRLALSQNSENELPTQDWSTVLSDTLAEYERAIKLNLQHLS